MIKTIYPAHYLIYYPPSTQAHVIELPQTEITEQQLLEISKDNNGVISYGITYYYQGKRLGTLAKARNILYGC